MPLAPCSHRPPCPGCPRFGELGPPPERLAALEAFAEAGGVALDRPELGAALGFRTRARLAVRGRSASPKIGIFQAGSHRIADIPRCPIHHPRINEVAACVRAAVREHDVRPYADRPHTGTLRYLQISIDRDDRAQVVLVGRESSAEPLAPVAAALEERLGETLHSLWWNGHPGRDNAVLGPHWRIFCGPRTLTEAHEGVTTSHPPGAFRQSHGELARRLVELVGAWLPAPGRAVEYFAGCGTIGLPLAARSDAISLNERAPDSLEGLALGIQALPAALRTRVRALAGPAEDHCDALETADTVILDPPRRGAGPRLIEAIRRSRVRRVLYVSCDVASFLREAEELTRASGLSLSRIRPFDFFPYAEHLEAVALFEHS